MLRALPAWVGGQEEPGSKGTSAVSARSAPALQSGLWDGSWSCHKALSTGPLWAAPPGAGERWEGLCAAHLGRG